MKTTDYLMQYKKEFSLRSNYAVAKKLEVSEATVAKWYHGKGSFSDEIVLKIADQLDIDERVLMADIHAEREKDPNVKKFWEQFAHQLKSVAACCFLFVVSGLPMDNAQAAGIMHADFNTNNLYIMRTFVRFRKWLQKALARVSPRPNRIGFC